MRRGGSARSKSPATKVHGPTIEAKHKLEAGYFSLAHCDPDPEGTVQWSPRDSTRIDNVGKEKGKKKVYRDDPSLGLGSLSERTGIRRGTLIPRELITTQHKSSGSLRRGGGREGGKERRYARRFKKTRSHLGPLTGRDYSPVQLRRTKDEVTGGQRASSARNLFRDRIFKVAPTLVDGGGNIPGIRGPWNETLWAWVDGEGSARIATRTKGRSPGGFFVSICPLLVI